MRVFSTSSHFLLFLEHYKYLVIFPIVVLEGPFVMIICGFLVSIGFLNGIGVYFLLVLGDTVGDILHYYIGYHSSRAKWIKRWGRAFGYDEKGEKFIEEHFKNHKGKTLFIAKVAHGVGTAIQVAAGVAKVDMAGYLGWNIIGTLPKVLVLMLIGFYAGASYTKFTSYLGTVAFVTIAVVAALIVGYVLVVKFATRSLKK